MEGQCSYECCFMNLVVYKEVTCSLGSTCSILGFLPSDVELDRKQLACGFVGCSQCGWDGAFWVVCVVVLGHTVFSVEGSTAFVTIISCHWVMCFDVSVETA